MIKKEQLENNVKENNVKENNVREYKNNNLENDKYLVYIISKDNLNEWEHFNSKYGNVFQSAGFFNVLNQTGTKTKILVVKQNSEIVGGVLFFFPLSGFKRFFSEMRVVSGPIINDDKVLSLILRSLSQIAIENKVTSIQLKMPFINKEKILINEDFTPLYTGPAYSFNVDLSTNKEELKNNLNKRTRNAINKAEREGVTIEEGHNIDIIYNLYMNRVRKKSDQIPIPKSYFEAIKEHTNSKFLVAKYNNKTIAESIFLEYNNIIYFFNNGSLPEYWKLNPNVLLIWKIIEQNSGSDKILNLYGVPDGKDKNHRSYGIFKFKSGFGGTLVQEFSYAAKIISPTKKYLFDKIVNFLLPLYKKIIK